MGVIQFSLLSAVVTAFLGMGITVWYEHHAASELREELKECGEKYVAQKTENANWLLHTNQQNLMIDQIKKNAKAREVEAAKASAEAKALRSQMATNAASIMAMKVDADDCKGAQQVLSTYLGARP